MTRKQQALVALACFVGGCVFAAVGAVGYEYGITWLDQGAVYPAGALWGIAVVFLLRAVLVGRPRRWMFPERYDRDADAYGRHHRSDWPRSRLQTPTIHSGPSGEIVRQLLLATV